MATTMDVNNISQIEPPSSVCFSPDDLNRADDARSELTEPPICSNDDADFSLQQDDESFGINIAADPYYYLHELADSKTTCQINKQENLKLKLQIIKQRESFDELLFKLSQCEVENEALRAEKAVLVDELALAAQKDTPGTSPKGWFSKVGGNKNGGSMQLLLDTNAKLMTDNSRLQVLSDITRKSFQSYVKDSSIASDKDKEIIKYLRKKSELLQQQLHQSHSCKLSTNEHTSEISLKYSMPDREHRNSSMDHTAKTSMESVSCTDHKEQEGSLHLIDSSHRSAHQDSTMINSLHSIPEQLFKFDATSGDDWISEGGDLVTNSKNNEVSERAVHRHTYPIVTKGGEAKNTFNKGQAASYKSEDLLVDFGETETSHHRPSTSTQRKLSQSLTERKSDGLLVDFGETLRPRSRDRRGRQFGSSVKW